MARGSVMETEETIDVSLLDQTAANADEEPTMTYEELVSLCAPIAKPMASRKLTKQIYKLLKKIKAADLRKECAHFGVKAVMRTLRRGDKKGFVVLAGDVSPIDFISHIPVFAEEKDIPYIYVPSEQDLALAVGTNSTMCVFVSNNEAISKYYEACLQEIQSTPAPVA